MISTFIFPSWVSIFIFTFTVYPSLLLLFTPSEIFTPFLLRVFHRSLRDRKSPQVSRTFRSILVVLNNAVVWMASTCPLISKSSSSFNNPLLTIPKAPTTIGITVTFMFHSFFNSQAKSRYLSFFSFSFNFIAVGRDRKVDNFANHYYYYYYYYYYRTLA